VRVGVVALEVAALEPQHALLAQRVEQHALDLGTRKSRMPLVQAAPGAEQGAVAVGFDGATLEGEFDAFARSRTEHTQGFQA
jgi:hypothetical protein